MRILVAFEDEYRAYRGVIAAAIRVFRPRAEVVVVGLYALGDEVARFDPHLVICNQPNTVDPGGRSAWVELPVDPTRPARACVGGPGNDGVTGGLGSDNVLGGSGNDFVFGDDGSDSAVVGEEGRDLVNGWTGTDRMLGEGGGDWIVDGDLDESSKDDILSGGAGDDIFFGNHVPAVKDIVSCGGGFDRAVVDRKDVVVDDCEEVLLVRGSFEEVLEQEEAFIESLPPEVRRFFFTFFEEQLAPFPATSRAATSPATR